MLAERRDDVARALLSPEPASQVVTRQYESLRKAARAQGVSLRRLRREPVFGPLVRDLARAEHLLRQMTGTPSLVSPSSAPELAGIHGRIRELHPARLAGLLPLPPPPRPRPPAPPGLVPPP